MYLCFMDDNKYYTPKKWEFYVDLEYEFRCAGEGEYRLAVIKDELQIDDIHNPVYDLRVKFLDKEDIESLGWTYDDRCSRFKKGEARLCFNDNKAWKSIIIQKNKTSPAFSDIAKNKNDLKKIMFNANIE